MFNIGEGIETDALSLYLSSSSDWSKERGNERRQVFRHKSGTLVFVPMQRATDFLALTMAAATEIAAAENRTPQEVAIDLVWRKFDKIHVHREAEESSLLYSAGVEMHQALGDLILSAARAVSEPRAVYVGGRYPRMVADYFDQVRMIPSEKGSFVVRALLPIIWSSTEPAFDMVGPPNQAVRQVSTTILRAAGVAVNTANQVVANENMERWNDAIEEGVSANLCEALTNLVGHGKEAGRISLRISWTWAKPADSVNPVEIPVELGEVLKAGAEYLRGQSDEETVLITGRVTTLHRESATGPGEITVTGFIEAIDSRNGTLRCELDEDTYRSAISAHDGGQTVTVSALVRPAPRGIVVQHVEYFRVQPRN